MTASIGGQPLVEQTDGLVHGHSLALTAEGEIYSWGWNGHGQLGGDTRDWIGQPTAVSSLSDAAMAAAGTSHSLVVTDAGQIQAWGSNHDGQLSDGTIDQLAWVSTAAAGASHSLAVTEDGRVYAWGFVCDRGCLVYGSGGLSPVLVPGLSGVTMAAAGSDHALLMTESGRVYRLGSNRGVGSPDAEGDDRWFAPVLVPELSQVTMVAAGPSHSLAVTGDGQLYSWGTVWDAEWDIRLGGGVGHSQRSPVLMQGLSDVVSAAGGGRHSLAVTGSGYVYAWGTNLHGQLGGGTSEDWWSSPLLVPGLSDVAMVSAGGSHSLAVTNAGQVYAWGANGSGQLGDGTTTNRSTPVLVPGLSDVAMVAAGASHSLAVTNGGQVYSWGDNASGQLGYSSDSATPKRRVDLDLGSFGATQTVGTPVISGAAQVGQALTVAEVTTTPPGGTVTYAWMVDGTEVKAGADEAARSYTPGADDAGKLILVRVTATREGYETVKLESGALTIVAANEPEPSSAPSTGSTPTASAPSSTSTPSPGSSQPGGGASPAPSDGSQTPGSGVSPGVAAGGGSPDAAAGVGGTKTASGNGYELPLTGSESASPLSAIAAGLVLIGGLLLLAARRRRQSSVC
ncbi:MAG: LPXTG cell wall anchor domain-containing protein [Bifidobacteriaceae bacterium]|nr:LPXTG cell wall anchor domain-containing protein [Bifidobacteriaceae bacterium]